MNWFTKINSQAFKAWLIGTSGGKLRQEKLDPFATSLRVFYHAHDRMQRHLNNQPMGIADVPQFKTDLQAAGLFSNATDTISALGNKVLSDWNAYGIPSLEPNYEIHRCLIVIADGINSGSTLYNGFVKFWKIIRSHFSFDYLITNPEYLYLISYFNKNLNGYNPFKVMVGLDMTDADLTTPVDWNSIKTYYDNDVQLDAAVDKYRNVLTGWVARRKGRISFCTALELFTNSLSSNQIINGLGISQQQKELLSEIVSTISNVSSMELNKIYFGAPGTGKSQKITQYTDDDNSIRVTFHPDTDYASFVGSYKPTENPENPGHITYKFVGQQFLHAYLRAWEGNENIYLVIEELNRGNVAQIFGDIFQLIERNAEGYSKYPIDIDADLSRFLKSHFESLVANGGIYAAKAERYNEYFGGSFNKMVLPNNLFIHATMNTSDQSLFPIDSAFKRRWDWEYIPIEFEGTEADNYLIKIGDENFSWRKFIEVINKKIETVTESEDKKLGQFFIKSYDDTVKEHTFKTKVMFYLWNDVLKDEIKSDDRYFFKGKVNAEDENESAFSFNDLFIGDSTNKLKEFMTYLGIPPEQLQELHD